MEKTRQITPVYLHKIGKVEKSIFEGKRKCDNLKDKGKGMIWKGGGNEGHFKIIVTVDVLANNQGMNNVIFFENPDKAKQHE